MDTKLEEKKPAGKAKGKEAKGSDSVLIENTSSALESNDENEGAHILNTQETNPQEPEAHMLGGVAGGLLPLMTPEELEEYMNNKKAIAAFSKSEEELKNVTAEKLFTDARSEHNDKIGENTSIHDIQELDYPKLMGKDYLEKLPATKQKERPTRSLTYGEKLAGVFDNPSDNEDLNRIKELAAEMIDIVAKNSSYKASETHSPEQLVFVGAINDVISAQQKCCKYIAM